MEQFKNYLSYYNILKDIRKFKRSGGVSSDEFNYFDTPGQYYFKIFFYFHNGDDETGIPSSSHSDSGLLAPTWEDIESDTHYYAYNSAWSYFKMNGDEHRAKKVEQFINLLSKISTESPWYFSEVTGIDAALERKNAFAANFVIEEERPKISIKCLPDSIDDRIGTLLDLYRDISFDYVNKVQLLPANLRKFDMGIYIFNAPLANIHGGEKVVDDWTMKMLDETLELDWFRNENDYADITTSSSHYIASHKYFEFHNCEFEYGSSKGAYSTLNNVDGTQNLYNIDISFDQVYENRYNEFLLNIMGDLVTDSLLIPSLDIDDNKKKSLADKLEERINAYKYDESSENNAQGVGEDDSIKAKIKNKAKQIKGDFKNNFVSGAKDQFVELGRQAAESLLKRVILGNLHTISLSRANDQINSLSQGNIIGTARALQDYYSNFKLLNKNEYKDNLGNLHTNPKPNTQMKKLGKLSEATSKLKNL